MVFQCEYKRLRKRTVDSTNALTGSVNGDEKKLMEKTWTQTPGMRGDGVKKNTVENKNVAFGGV